MSNRFVASSLWFLGPILRPRSDSIRNTTLQKKVSTSSYRLQLFDSPNPTLLAPNGISHQDNPEHGLLVLRPPNVAAHYDLNFNQRSQARSIRTWSTAHGLH